MAAPYSFQIYKSIGWTLRPLLRLWLRWRASHGKEDGAGLPERRGIAGLARPDARVIWLHAASVGESLSAMPLVERLAAHGAVVLMTTGTVTSAAMVRARSGPRLLHQFAPLDVAPWVEAFLAYWQPALAIRVESEIWPVTLRALAERNIPTAMVNGRLSDRTMRGWQRAPAFAHHVFGSLNVVAAQSDEDAARFKALGARRAENTGNVKLASPALAANIEALSDLQSQVSDRPRWLAASIHPGEDAVVATAHNALREKFGRLLTVVVPRHPERGPAMAETFMRAGLRVAVRSQNQRCDESIDVLLADTMGELGLFYRLCPIAFIGKTFTVGGGQNPIEAAQLGSALVWGPDMSNFRDLAQQLEAAGGAVKVSTGADLGHAIGALLGDNARRDAQAGIAATITGQNNAALDRTFALIEPYLAAAKIR